MMFYSDDLYFAKRGDNGNLWGPILEKAFAKVKGSYAMANGGYTVSGIRSLTGLPVFYYQMGSECLFAYDYCYIEGNNTDVFPMLKAADDLDHILAAGTVGVDTGVNSCGIVGGHAYAIIAAFELKTSGTVDHNMLMIRNPWGETYWNNNWNY